MSLYLLTVLILFNFFQLECVNIFVDEFEDILQNSNWTANKPNEIFEKLNNPLCYDNSNCYFLNANSGSVALTILQQISTIGYVNTTLSIWIRKSGNIAFGVNEVCKISFSIMGGNYQEILSFGNNSLNPFPTGLNVTTVDISSIADNINSISIEIENTANINDTICVIDHLLITGMIDGTKSPTKYSPTTGNPSKLPTPTPLGTITPSKTPTIITKIPTKIPTNIPTILPTKYPSILPTMIPTIAPANTLFPTIIPSNNPTLLPTKYPTIFPTYLPTKQLTTIITVENDDSPTSGLSELHKTIIYISVGFSILLIILILVIFCLVKKLKQNSNEQQSNTETQMATVIDSNPKPNIANFNEHNIKNYLPNSVPKTEKQLSEMSDKIIIQQLNDNQFYLHGITSGKIPKNDQTDKGIPGDNNDNNKLEKITENDFSVTGVESTKEFSEGVASTGNTGKYDNNVKQFDNEYDDNIKPFDNEYSVDISKQNETNPE